MESRHVLFDIFVMVFKRKRCECEPVQEVEEEEGIPGIPKQYQAEADLTHLKEDEDIAEEKKRQEPRGIYS